MLLDRALASTTFFRFFLNVRNQTIFSIRIQTNSTITSLSFLFLMNKQFIKAQNQNTQGRAKYKPRQQAQDSLTEA
jgi:hypothetical protein